jgi:hypothetical protein
LNFVAQGLVNCTLASNRSKTRGFRSATRFQNLSSALGHYSAQLRSALAPAHRPA